MCVPLALALSATTRALRASTKVRPTGSPAKAAAVSRWFASVE